MLGRVSDSALLLDIRPPPSPHSSEHPQADLPDARELLLVRVVQLSNSSFKIVSRFWASFRARGPYDSSSNKARMSSRSCSVPSVESRRSGSERVWVRPSCSS